MTGTERHRTVREVKVTSQMLNILVLILTLMGTATLKASESEIHVLIRPTLEIFLFPLTIPCLTGMGRSVGELFYFTSQTRYPLNLIVSGPTLGNNIKYTNNLQLKIFFKYNTVYIGQFFKLANCQ